MTRSIRVTLAAMTVFACVVSASVLSIGDVMADAGDMNAVYACQWFGFFTALAAIFMLWLACRRDA